MNFSFCAIARNESKTLPRMIESLKEFQNRGGVVVLVDTGSTDNTAALAREAGYLVEEVGDKFRSVVTKELADQINTSFIAGDEGCCIQEGETYFDFASARNYAASLCPTDMVSSIDCDEVVSKIDYDQIEAYIQEGYTQFEYNFVFAHREDGTSALEFTQSKFFDRRVIQWEGMVHEVLQGPGNIKYLDCFQLDHYQNFETNRHSYLTGLAVDCSLHPEKDRNAHYFARELMWEGKHRSALQEFQRHVAMDKWPAERAQSYIFMGDIYGRLGEHDEQRKSYQEALHIDPYRRVAPMRLARFYQFHNNPTLAKQYGYMALNIPWSAFYANDKDDYEQGPHEVLYWACGWLGNISEARYHLEICKNYRPDYKQYVDDQQYYVDKYEPTVLFVIPTLGREEGLRKAIESIQALEYPQDKIKIVTNDDIDMTVPNKVKEMVDREPFGEVICYASNDVVFAPDSLRRAVDDMNFHDVNLVSFNTGSLTPDHGNICEHFIIKRDAIKHLPGKSIFDCRYYHVGVDNILWARMVNDMDAVRSNFAYVEHNHFSTGKSEMDEVYKKGWDAERVAHDRALLKADLALLHSS